MRQRREDGSCPECQPRPHDWYFGLLDRGYICGDCLDDLAAWVAAEKARWADAYLITSMKP